MSKVLFYNEGYIIEIIDKRFLRDKRFPKENEALYVSACPNRYGCKVNKQGEMTYTRDIWENLWKPEPDYWRVRDIMTEDVREAWICPSKEYVEDYLKNVNITTKVIPVKYEIKTIEKISKRKKSQLQPPINRFQLMDIR